MSKSLKCSPPCGLPDKRHHAGAGREDEHHADQRFLLLRRTPLGPSQQPGPQQGGADGRQLDGGTAIGQAHGVGRDHPQPGDLLAGRLEHRGKLVAGAQQRALHPQRDQDLAARGFAAQPRRPLGDVADRAVVDAALEADAADGGKTGGDRLLPGISPGHASAVGDHVVDTRS